MKRTKIFKAGVLSMILFLVVSLMNTRAFAETITGDAITKETKGTITVSGIEKGVEVSVYKLTSVNFDNLVHQPTYPPYSWNEKVKTWLENHATYSEYATKLEAMEEKLNTDEAKADFYDAIAKAIKGTGIDLSPVETMTVGDTGTATTQELEMGTYLILIENGLKVYKVSTVNLTPYVIDGVWNFEKERQVEIKSSDVGIKMEETVATQTASTTDEITFKATADVPKYPTSQVATSYYISGVVEDGLTYKADSVKVYGIHGDVTEEIKREENAYTIETQRPDSKGSADFTLNFDYTKICAYEKICVEYMATLQQDTNTVIAEKKMDGDALITENANKAVVYLDYNNNPYEQNNWNTQSDDAYIFTFEITVKKVNEKNEVLAGAEFELLDSADNKLTFVNKGNGVYYKAATGTTTLVVGDETDVAMKGILQIKGLDNGTYKLVERKAPDGYNKLLTTETIQIEDSSQSKEVVNKQGFQLPLTGGTGTVVFTAVGMVFIGAGILLFIAMYRKNKTSK